MDDAVLTGGALSSETVRVVRPTMKDVAAHAGVALKTVSRVVNAEAGVSAPTRELVLSSIAALGFRRNASAASLRQGMTASIGLIVEDISEPFQSVIARAVERVALGRDVLLFAASSSDDSDRERGLTLSLASRPVDGLIVIPSAMDHSYLRAEIAAGLSTVFIDRPAQGIDADTVLTDNRRGAQSGVEHLIRHGHRRIAFIGDPEDIYTGFERFAGYLDAIGKAGIPPDADLISLGEPEPGRIHAHLQHVATLQDPATALFTGNSLNTLVTLRVLDASPARLAHVAFDDFETFDLLKPGITVVAQDPVGMGTAAAELLFRRIAGDKSSVQTVLLHTTLIERGSGEIAP